MKKHAMLILMWLSIVVTLLTLLAGTLNLVASGMEPVVAEKYMLYPAQLLRQDGGLDLHKLNEGLVRDGLPAVKVTDSNFDLAVWLASNGSTRNARRYRENAILAFVTSAVGFAMCVMCWWGRPRASQA